MTSLSATSILELMTLRSKLAALKKKETELTTAVKEELEKQAGRPLKDGDIEEYGPSSCPFKFVLRVSNRSGVSWRDEWYDLAVQKWGEEAATKREVKMMVDSEKPVGALKVETNEKFVKKERAKQ